MKRRKRLLAGLLCAILSVTTVMPTGIQASAKQSEQGGASLIAEETAGKAAELKVRNTEAGAEDTGTETATETEVVTEKEAETETETAAKMEAETETETAAEKEAETETETVAEQEAETGTETEEEPEAGEYPNAEIPFEIGGTDIYAGLGNISLYRTSRVDVTAAKYDPRIEAPDEMTAVGNQNPYGTCWAFAMMATLENSMIRQEFSDNSINLSERHLAYFTRNSGSDKLGNASGDTIISSPEDAYLRTGGNAILAASRLMNWQGAAAEADYPYFDTGLIDAAKAQEAAVLAHDVYFVPTKAASREEKMEAVKKLIAEYGCVQWSYMHKNTYYNSATHAYFDPKDTSTNHAITVVGWDDDYPLENFSSTNRPGSNGAWIVKNSWGAAWGENGYFYISYEDTSIGSANPASVSVAALPDTYDNNYFHGNTAYLPKKLSSYKKVSQVYQIQSAGEQLEAISVMLYSDKTDYSIQIYINPELTEGVVKNPESGEEMLDTPITGRTGYAGLYTIDLPEAVALAKGDYLAIVIDFSASDNTGKSYAYLYTDSTDSQTITASGRSYEIQDKNEVHPGESFYYSSGSWIDAGMNDNFNFRINALTTNSELVLSENRLELAKNRVRKLSVLQLPTGSTEQTVSFVSSNENVVTVSADGFVTGISAGSAAITAKSKDDNGKEASAVCKVTVTDTTDIAGGSYEGIIWFIDENGKLTVEGTGEFAPAGSKEDADTTKKRSAPWYAWNEKITSAKVKVTGMTDASYMFDGCRNLTDVDFDEFDTSQITDMTRMFYDCYGLNSLDLSGFDTGRVQYMEGMFQSCTNLESLNLSSFDTGSVTNMHELFCNCYDLKEIDLEHFNTSKVTDMSFMFGECRSLTNIDLSHFDTGSVTDMTRMFINCWKLTDLDLSNFDTENVTGMTWMFYGCTQLETVDLSGFDMGKTDAERVWGIAPHVDKLADMFEECPNLSVIYAPANLPHSVDLPLGDENDIWYQPEGEWCQSGETKITELPKNLKDSILLTKNERPKVSCLTVEKTKTDYECGEAITLEDLTVSYVNHRGMPAILLQTADYTTNAAEIDLSTPGVKTLIIIHKDEETGKEVTAEIELTAVYILREGSLLIRLSDEAFDGVIYDGTPKTPALEVKTSLAGVLLTEGQDYTAVYENNIDAGTASVTITGQNEYQGTASFSFTIEKAAAPEAEEAEVCYPYGREQKEQTFDIAGRFTKYGKITGYHVSYTENTEADRQIFSEAPYIADGILCYSTNAGQEGDLAKITTEVSFANYENTVVVLNVKFVDAGFVYTVTFDMGGHGAEIPPVIVYGYGGLIDEPKQPEEKGYRFLGWYKDKDCTELWNFNTDMVEDNMTLYAGWLAVPQRVISAGELYIQEIKKQTYTGSPIKPALQVYAAAKDGNDIPLKQGKDYTIKFYNNINADSVQKTGGISANGEEGDNGFTKSLPYAVITGKGNYTGTVYQNFHIAPAVIVDEDSANADKDGADAKNNTTLAQGFTLKYKDQLTSGKKAQKPFTSIKYKKSMKLGRDYTLQLSALEAYDAQGNVFRKGAVIGTAGSTLQDTTAPAIPAGAKGSFLLTLTGKGNYSGTVQKTVYVSDKSHLMKNASVVLGKNQKKLEYAGENISLTLTPAYYDTSVKKYYGFKENAGVIVMDTETELEKSNVFTVKLGKTYLKYGEDFEVDYVNNAAVGTATMRLKGIGEYSGTKDITFRITGTAFHTNNISIDGLQASMEYTGKALTQNGVVLKGINGSKSGEELVYRKDYTISYKNNLKKGTATMTFTAKPSSGYTGSFKKTFKIDAAMLAAKGTAEDTVEILTVTPAEDRIEYTENGIHFMGKVVYTKAGAKISDRISLKNKEGFVLKEGTDYTVSYSNNKAVTAGTAGLPPAMTIKGRGNYTGELTVTFEISKASLEENENLSVTTTAVAYNKTKAWEYEYRPKVKLMDGGQALSAQKDYDITYYLCGQGSLHDYFTDSRTLRPYAVVTAKEEGNYEGSRKVGLTVYQNKLTGSNLYVVMTQDASQLTYTGEQVRPEVTVYYGDPKEVKKAKKEKVTDENTLLQTYGLKKLVPKEGESGDYHITGGDYILTYGTNTAAGKNKGSVTITGTDLYGGSVKVKFTILKKDVYNASK